jgi:hypothetical protein
MGKKEWYRCTRSQREYFGRWKPKFSNLSQHFFFNLVWELSDKTFYISDWFTTETFVVLTEYHTIVEKLNTTLVWVNHHPLISNWACTCDDTGMSGPLGLMILGFLGLKI